MPLPVSPMDAVKAVYEAVQKYNDVPLMKQVFDLQTSIQTMRVERDEALDKVRELEKKLALRGEMKAAGPLNYFYQDGDLRSHCPKCWQGDEKAVLLPDPYESGDRTYRKCPVCQQAFKESERPSRPPRIRLV